MHNRGDIYMANIKKIGEHVQCGTRPVLIVSNNTGNLHSDIVIGCPITSKVKNYLPTHVFINLEKQSIILCEQIMTLNKNCFWKKMGTISNKKMVEVNRALAVSLGLKVHNE